MSIMLSCSQRALILVLEYVGNFGARLPPGCNRYGVRVPCMCDDDVGLYVLGCRVDTLGTNCTKLLKVKMSGGWGVGGWGWGGGGERVALASVRVIMSGGQQGAYCCIKKTFCRWDSILLRIKNDDHLLTAVDGPVMRAAYIKNC